MKFYFFILPLLLVHVSLAQTVQGTVSDENNEPLTGATVLLPKSLTGTFTDRNGHFSLENKQKESILIVRFVGYKTDTISLNGSVHFQIQLMPDNNELNDVVVQSGTTFIDKMKPIHAEVITEKELRKSACCNLSESFENNASVDVSFTDAITGTKTIQMLGLDGKYVQINRENMPNVRGLNARKGLNYIPGTWIQSIDLIKGSATVVNGYESMTGQIDIEWKKPDNGERLYVNAYGNSFGRAELNANTSFKINDKWSGALLTHSNYFNNEIDRNKDGFMDLPKSKQINVLNRYKYQGERIDSQVGINVMLDEQAGGQNGFDFGDNAATSPIYGYASNSSKIELFGKTGLLFPHAPYKGWGLIYSGTIQKQDVDYAGRSYSGSEKTFYTNLIHQNIISNSMHQYKTGASFLMDSYKESFADSAFSRNEIVPGAFFEYTYLPNEKFTLVAGMRSDYHNLYGVYWTPRLHVRYEIVENGTLRLSAGKGYRTSNIIPENNQIFVSSRKLVVEEKLQPEESWNYGGSFVKEMKLGSQKLTIITDFFHTEFQNQVITDMDQNPSEVRFYNLDGRSYANSFQFEIGSQINQNFSTKAAYKYYDVKATINDALLSIPYISKQRLFWNLSYASKFDIWQANLTVQWFGKKRLPETTAKPTEFQRPEYSPDFSNVNAQVSRTFRWGNVYLGSENLLDFRQKDPIIDSANPFGENFDGSMVWGPVAGRMVYCGVRFEIDK